MPTLARGVSSAWGTGPAPACRRSPTSSGMCGSSPSGGRPTSPRGRGTPVWTLRRSSRPVRPRDRICCACGFAAAKACPGVLPRAAPRPRASVRGSLCASPFLPNPPTGTARALADAEGPAHPAATVPVNEVSTRIGARDCGHAPGNHRLAGFSDGRTRPPTSLEVPTRSRERAPFSRFSGRTRSAADAVFSPRRASPGPMDSKTAPEGRRFFRGEGAEGPVPVLPSRPAVPAQCGRVRGPTRRERREPCR